MEKFTSLTGIAAPLNLINIDTDMIIPKQFLKTIKRTGLGRNLFHEMRYREDGSENPEFILNERTFRETKIIIAGDNFGCGSSREHAPWALLDFGIRCIISTSFADIFYNNCFKNGILPIKIPKADIKNLLENTKRGANATITIDLEEQKISDSDGNKISFDVDSFKKECLINGLDDIGLTMEKSDKISEYEKKLTSEKPWL